jgi:small GTP-binding protein
MNLTKLKVCMIGATAVGKSSLVNRYVSSIFSDAYRTTIGVKIESRRIEREGRAFDIVIWDLSGEDEFQNVQASYLRGASGYLLIIDGTRPETIEVASALSAHVRSAAGTLPFIVVLNKCDLVAQWQVCERERAAMRARGWHTVDTSAKTGQGVDVVFDALVDAIMRGNPWT